jgi:hypothetical protein
VLFGHLTNGHRLCPIVSENIVVVRYQLEMIEKGGKASQAVTAHVWQRAIAIYDLHFVYVIDFSYNQKAIGSDSKSSMANILSQAHSFIFLKQAIIKAVHQNKVIPSAMHFEKVIILRQKRIFNVHFPQL